jgi:hypothetical protein
MIAMERMGVWIGKHSATLATPSNGVGESSLKREG